MISFAIIKKFICMLKSVPPIFILLLFISTTTLSQTEIKFNALTSAILIPNAGIEFQLGEKSSFQFDVLASFWDSFDGYPLHVTQIFPEYRQYFKPNMRGFFVGAHIGVGMFTLSKFGYQNHIHQSGRNTYYGLTIGYKTDISKHWAMEFFVGGGSTQANYRSYNFNTGEREDDKTNQRWFNKSGELIPYRGGIMLVYKLGSRSRKKTM